MTRAIDQWFPPRGPCGICGGPDARHRILDAIRDYVAAGETPENVAEELCLPVEAVHVALEQAA